MFIAQIYEKNSSKSILLNRNGSATLNKLTKCISKETLNGEYELEFEYPLDDEKVKYIQNWNVVKAGGQLFRIYNINEDMINHTVNVKARHIFYDLDNAFILDNRAEKKTVKQAMQIALKCEDREIENIFTVDSDIQDINTLYMIEQSPLTSIFEIINRWKKGELIRDNFHIEIRNDVTYSSGIEIRYKKNMLALNKETDIDRICTRIYPKGKNGITLSEKYIKVPNIEVGGENAPPMERTKVVYFEEAEDVTNLRLLAEKYVEKLALPFENIKVDFLDVSSLEKYEKIEGLKQVKVGDVVDVYHDLYNRHYKFKCVYVERDFLNEANNKVELGEIREYLQNVDFSEVYNAMEDIKPTLYFYRNDKDLDVNNLRETQLFYEGISVSYNTHLKLYIALNGVSDSDGVLDVKILINNQPIEFTPKHKLNIGNNIIGIPLAIPALQGGQAYYLSVRVQTDKGVFTIPQWNAQVFAEGVGLGGGTSAENPHIEFIDYVSAGEIISDFDTRAIKTNINAGITKDIVTRKPFETVNASDIIENAKVVVSENITITLEEVNSES